MELIQQSPDMQLQIIATGSHMSEAFGLTYRFIEEDGFAIDEKIDMELHTEDLYSIPRSMGICAEKVSYAFRRLQPDLVVVLGDRYELLPIINTALLFNIPIAHISGGDITEGAIDNEVRNAVSMMSALHFPGTEESAARLRRMRGSDEHIHAVGEPGLDSFLRYEMMSRTELADSLCIHPDKKWVLVTLHSETKESLAYNTRMAEQLYEAIRQFPQMEFVVTKANADFGGSQINAFWDTLQDENVRVIASLGQRRYLSYMKQVCCVMGNSSSGIVEAPFMGIPVINMGDRQKGRHICRNVINTSIEAEDIVKAMQSVDDYKIVDTFWGDGHTSERIVSYIHEFLYGKA
jgi:UDP-hydrolysing UDP-N-acetyl-D-glucosamine 2-epimerase